MHESYSVASIFHVNVIYICQWWAVRKGWPYPVQFCNDISWIVMRGNKWFFDLGYAHSKGNPGFIYKYSVIFTLYSVVCLVERCNNLVVVDTTDVVCYMSGKTPWLLFWLQLLIMSTFSWIFAWACVTNCQTELHVLKILMTILYFTCPRGNSKQQGFV